MKLLMLKSIATFGKLIAMRLFLKSQLIRILVDLRVNFVFGYLKLLIYIVSPHNLYKEIQSISRQLYVSNWSKN